MDSHVNKINRDLVIGWLLIVGALCGAYLGEVIKGQRDWPYMIVFMALTAFPAVIVLILYLRNPSWKYLRYYIVAGYFIMYVFVMLSGRTSMVFSYILPMLSLLVLYHQPKLILGTGIAAVLLNFISVGNKIFSGKMTLENSKDAEIQMALLIFCFGGSYVATRIYDEIKRENEDYVRRLDEKNNQIQKMTLQTIATIANTIDAKDEYTKGHSKRVSEYSAAIATKMGLSEKEVQNIRSIALLHDIGKIGVPDAVLNKPGKHTQEEFQLMKQHASVGGEILKDIGMLPGIDIGAKYHHERYDGKGYPEGLKGENIPLIARIIAVADAYDAMTSNRVYRVRLSDEKVMKELKEGIGTQFDPEAVNALITLIDEGLMVPQSTDGTNSREFDEATDLLRRIIEQRDRQAAEKRILDELTGTYNRSYGKRLLGQTVEQQAGTLFVFDMDKFHSVNDQAGFITGDVYLRMVAAAIRKISENIIVSRFEGDEFVAFSPDIRTGEGVREVLERFIKEIRYQSAQQEELKKLSVSVGAVILEQAGNSLDEYLLKADKALYVAKTQGGNQFYIYSTAAPMMEGNLSKNELNHLMSMIKNKGYYEGAFQLSYPEFQRIYEFVSKVAQRNQQKVQVLLFTVVSNNEDKMTVEERERMMGILEQAIIVSVRGVDVTTRYSSTQRLVLLMNLEESSIHLVTERIMKEFFKMYGNQNVNLYYDVADLDW